MDIIRSRMLCRSRPTLAVTGRTARRFTLPVGIAVKLKSRKTGIKVTREGFLVWDESAQADQLTSYCVDTLGWTTAEVEIGLAELAAILPNLPACLKTMAADDLLGLLTQRHAVAGVLLALRVELPTADVPEIVRNNPSLLTAHTPESIRERISLLRSQLPWLASKLDGFLELEPRLLESDIDVNDLAACTNVGSLLEAIGHLSPMKGEGHLGKTLLRRYILEKRAS